MMIPFIVGLIFGLGLIVSGMANPAKVLGFLDLAGNWDPSLMFVMGGAIGVAFFAFRWAKSRHIPLPTGTNIDRRLIFGSLAFGAGWGIAGFCPGPALVALGMGLPKALVFIAAMLAGMGIYELVNRAQKR
ncbi:DUF6691 family protein [Duganella sp.]|uniref:DUF6691 family protein n=1 Tax=Duganella sp. TaxID=1904440 RepID=UPI0031D1E502